MGETVRIARVDHKSEVIAQHIHAVQMQAYAQEAELLGAVDFPPLRRTIGDICTSDEEFFGAYCGDQLVGSISVQAAHQQSGWTICSLVVAPTFQRRGIGKRLVEAVLRQYGDHDLNVQTGAKNAPALNLYTQLGFSERERWLVGHEPLEIIRLCRPATVRGSVHPNAA